MKMKLSGNNMKLFVDKMKLAANRLNGRILDCRDGCPGQIILPGLSTCAHAA
jgi:hypothetical protein